MAGKNAKVLLIFLWQWPFFIGTDFDRVRSFLLYHGYVLAWMLPLTSFAHGPARARRSSW